MKKQQQPFFFPVFRHFYLAIFLVIFLGGCTRGNPAGVLETTAYLEVTGYCGCSKCCSWERGSWKWLKLDFWNKYVSAGKAKNRPYSGLTASGKKPQEPQEGLFSADSLYHPWKIPGRLLLFPWYFMPRDGSIAADTRHYPFGTRMYIPGYGWGEVVDRGGSIKGTDRIDLYFSSHQDALKWGRKKVRVRIIPPR